MEDMVMPRKYVARMFIFRLGENGNKRKRSVGTVEKYQMPRMYPFCELQFFNDIF